MNKYKIIDNNKIREMIKNIKPTFNLSKIIKNINISIIQYLKTIPAQLISLFSICLYFLKQKEMISFSSYTITCGIFLFVLGVVVLYKSQVFLNASVAEEKLLNSFNIIFFSITNMIYIFLEKSSYGSNKTINDVLFKHVFNFFKIENLTVIKTFHLIPFIILLTPSFIILSKNLIKIISIIIKEIIIYKKKLNSYLPHEFNVEVSKSLNRNEMEFFLNNYKKISDLPFKEISKGKIKREQEDYLNSLYK